MHCMYNCILFAKTFFLLLPKQTHSLKTVLHAREQFQVSTQAEEVGGDEEDVFLWSKKMGVTFVFGHFFKGLCQYPLVWTDHEIAEFCR